LTTETNGQKTGRDRPASGRAFEITPEMIEAGVILFREWRYAPDNVDQLDLGGLGDARGLVEMLFRYLSQSQKGSAAN